ncbi:MAG: pilus assembly protein TadG-related protein [Acidimicrobiales bacterium]
MTLPDVDGGEAGQVTAIWAVLALSLFLLGGLVHDGGQILTARREADNLARQAARAGAQVLDENSLRAGAAALDPVGAETSVRAYLDRRHLVPIAVEVTASDVTVTVAMTQPTPLLSLVGIGSRTVSATATARSARGVVAMAGS